MAIYYDYEELEIASHSFAMTIWVLCKTFAGMTALTYIVAGVIIRLKQVQHELCVYNTGRQREYWKERQGV